MLSKQQARNRLLLSKTLNMEAVRSSETSISYRPLGVSFQNICAAFFVLSDVGTCDPTYMYIAALFV
jgi:hypothetical protein